MNGCVMKSYLLTALTVSAALLAFPGCPPEAADEADRDAFGQLLVRPGNWAFTLFGDFGTTDEVDAGVTLNPDGTTSNYAAPIHTLGDSLVWWQDGDVFWMTRASDPNSIDPNLDPDRPVPVYEAIVEFPRYLEGRFFDEKDPTNGGTFVAYFVETDHDINPPDGPDPEIEL